MTYIEKLWEKHCTSEADEAFTDEAIMYLNCFKQAIQEAMEYAIDNRKKELNERLKIADMWYSSDEMKELLQAQRKACANAFIGSIQDTLFRRNIEDITTVKAAILNAEVIDG